jgi:hypothetical protein
MQLHNLYYALRPRKGRCLPGRVPHPWGATSCSEAAPLNLPLLGVGCTRALGGGEHLHGGAEDIRVSPHAGVHGS